MAWVDRYPEAVYFSTSFSYQVRTFGFRKTFLHQFFAVWLDSIALTFLMIGAMLLPALLGYDHVTLWMLPLGSALGFCYMRWWRRYVVTPWVHFTKWITSL